MAEEIKIPAQVLALAEQSATERVPHPNPIAWKEYPDKWVVVFEDGRKMTFGKDEAKAKSAPAPKAKPAKSETA
jgi:hypothetical protein